MTQVTDRERRAYKRKLNEIAKRHNRLEESTVRQSIVLLRDLRSRIAGLLTEHENFEQYRLRELQDNINNMIAQYEGQLVQLMSQTVKDSHALGGQFAVEPLEAAGIKNLFFRPSQAQVNTLLDYNAAMIRSVPADAVRKINNQIRIAALGEGSTFQAMKNITQIMGMPKRASDPAKGIAYEAERIFRTETNRVFNLANHSQQLANAEVIPGLLKQWVATGDSRTRSSHLAAHGQTVPIAKKFKIKKQKGGYDMMDYPQDPSASAGNTINCRCRSVEVLPEFADMETPLDEKVAAEKAKRDEQGKDPVYDKIEAAEAQLIGLENEAAGVYNSRGELLFTKQGTKSAVEFSVSQMSKMKGGILTHNHPHGYPFSKDDFMMLAKGDLTEMRVVGRAIYTTGEGNTVSKAYRYTLKANKEVRSSFSVDWYFMNRADKLDDKLRAKFIPMIQSGKMTAAEANYNHMHRFWRDISGELQDELPGAEIIYTRIEL